MADVTPIKVAAAGAKPMRGKATTKLRSWAKVPNTRLRCWYDAKGEEHYQVRQTIGGTKHEFFLKAGLDLEGAVAEYKRFLEDPRNYDPNGNVGTAPIFLTSELIKEFLEWSKLYGGKAQRGTTQGWRNSQRLFLIWWMEKLQGKDLRAGGPRSVTLAADVVPALHTKDPKTGAKTRIPTYRHKVGMLIKLYRWLREVEHRLEPHEDPTFGKLKAPPARPAQRDEATKVVPIERIFAVVNWLREDASAPSTVLLRDGSREASTLQRIIDAAKRTLNERGAAGFTVKGKGAVIGHIAREAGVTPTTLYYYFSGGASLLRTAQTGEYDWEENRREGSRGFEPSDRRAPDILLFLAATGWHLSELNRFMTDGKIHPKLPFAEIRIPPAYQDIVGEGDGVLECAEAKRGGTLKTRVSAKGLEVANRLKGSGKCSTKFLGDEIERACAALGVPSFKPSWLRHTVATYATNNGAPDTAVSAFLNHGSSTTRRYYDRGVAAKVPTPV